MKQTFSRWQAVWKFSDEINLNLLSHWWKPQKTIHPVCYAMTNTIFYCTFQKNLTLKSLSSCIRTQEHKIFTRSKAIKTKRRQCGSLLRFTAERWGFIAHFYHSQNRRLLSRQMQADALAAYHRFYLLLFYLCVYLFEHLALAFSHVLCVPSIT